MLATTGCGLFGDDEPSAVDATLNLQTLEAETELGTLQAERAETSYVRPLGEGRAIGIAYLDDVTADDRDPEQIAVFLYDDEDLAVLIGDIDSDGAGTLESGDRSDFDATVEVVIEDGAVSGTATFPGEQPIPYTADAATGVASVYWARGTDENPDVSGDWVVLSDRRQWGCVCVPPFTSPCCSLRF